MIKDSLQKQGAEKLPEINKKRNRVVPFDGGGVEHEYQGRKRLFYFSSFYTSYIILAFRFNN